MPKGVYPRTTEHKAAISAGHIGLRHSPETRAKISAAVSGETRAELSLVLRGRRLSPETCAKISVAKTKDGRSSHPLYSVWRDMITRCFNPRRRGYKNYGGRGISVYPRWRTEPFHFFQYVENVLGPKPGPEYSLDRINNDGNYEPSNCRWATPTEQNQNRRGRS